MRDYTEQMDGRGLEGRGNGKIEHLEHRLLRSCVYETKC